MIWLYHINMFKTAPIKRKKEIAAIVIIGFEQGDFINRQAFEEWQTSPLMCQVIFCDYRAC